MRRPHHPRGSALVLGIVVSVVISALVTTMAWVATEQTQRTASLSKIDQAFFAAEAGMQRVQWYCRVGQMAGLSAPLTGSVNGYNYTTTWTPSGCTLRINCVGSVGNVSYAVSELITDPYAVPALQSMGAFDNKNIDLTGDVIAGGNYANGGVGTLNGNLIYYGTATGTGAVTGAVVHGKVAPRTINFTTLTTTLAAAAGRTYTGDQSGVTFDFTTLPGPNRVIYVNGNVIYPTIKGSGTLAASGSITTGAFGTPVSPVNLVAAGDINLDNNAAIYGSLYTAGNWNRGKFQHSGGVIYTGGVLSYNSGQSSIVQGATPWFDPRMLAAGFGGSDENITVVNFTGPLP